MAKKTASSEFHQMGTLKSNSPDLDGKRIDIEASVSLSPTLGQKLDALLSSDDDSIRGMCAITNLDPKKDLAYGDWKNCEFKNEGDLLENANLRLCTFTDTVWENSSIKGALLEGADFTNAKGLTENDFAGAYTSDETIFPEGIDRARVQELHRALNMPQVEPFKPRGREGMITIPATVTITDTTPPRPKFSS